MGENIRLRASDGFEFNAFRSSPNGPPRGGVVVIQEIWGDKRAPPAPHLRCENAA